MTEHEKYLKLVEFVRMIKKWGCDLHDCRSCDALKLLREIGEAE